MKRARTAATRASASSSSSPADADAPKLTLHGGVPHHPALAGLWRAERLTDITLSAEGVKFKAHRVALASSSGYFLNLFESGMRDAADATHAIDGIRPGALEVLLAFVYEGECQIDEGELTEVLRASDLLIVDDLKAACARAIGANLAPSNALDAWRLSEVVVLPGLREAAVQAALHGFEQLPVEQATGAEVVALVQEDRLVARSEEAVFQWVKAWWEAGARPEAELLAVLRHVRFGVMAEGFLRETVRAWPAMVSSAEAKDVLSDAVLPTAGGARVAPRSGVGPRLIYAVGGSPEYGVRLSAVELYDPQAASWTPRAGMTVARCMHGCVALEGKLYAVGGEGADGVSQPLDTAEVYDPRTDGWQPLAKMRTGRIEFALVAVGGKVYAIGGWDGDGILESAEAYDPQLGAWAPVASMGVSRGGHASAVLGGEIYVMGGYALHGPLNVVEAYDTQADSWQRVAPMPQHLFLHAAAAMGGKIYVTGGQTDQVDATNAAYAYDPRVDAWTQLANMGNARQQHASAAVGGKLYVFGGRDGDEEGVSTVEVYDPASDSWAQVTSLTSARYNFVAAAL